MPPCKLPAYRTERILTEEARAEVALLRIKIYISCGTFDPVEFDGISKRLTLLLQLLKCHKVDTPPL